MPRLCTVEGCDRTVKSKQLCHMHYRRQLNHGDPLYQPSHSQHRIPSQPMIDAIRQAAALRGTSIRSLAGGKVEANRITRLGRSPTVCLFEADRILVRVLGLTVDEVYGMDVG